MRLTWVTDIHLNFVGQDDFERFAAAIDATAPDRVWVGGDIAEAPTVVGWLERLADRLARPIDFVLGNHDYYHGSISEVRRQVRALAAQRADLCWLDELGPIELTPEAALVGCGGWGDGRHGDFMRSPVLLNDYLLIEDLVAPRAELAERLRGLGEQAACQVYEALEEAASRYPRVFLLTHVPPFVGACWHAGRISGEDWLPHFTCQATGDAILEVMARHPHCALTVLCGHTHGHGTYTAVPNVLVLTGAAEYGVPTVARTFELS